jgi:acetyl-CoA carboxylase biotin carboxyl carrier protein
MGHLNLKELKELIDFVSEKGFAEFELERQGFRLRLTRFQETLPAPAQPAVTPAIPRPVQPSPVEGSSSQPDSGAMSTSGTAPSAAAPAEVPQPEAAMRTIKSPIVGTFYRSASPTSEPFVKVGDHVEPDSVVCIIEAMKLMNEIQAEFAGEIVTIYPENAQAVEYGEPLFQVKI